MYYASAMGEVQLLLAQHVHGYFWICRHLPREKVNINVTFRYVFVYLANLLVLTKGKFNDHLLSLKELIKV